MSKKTFHIRCPQCGGEHYLGILHPVPMGWVLLATETEDYTKRVTEIWGNKRDGKYVSFIRVDKDVADVLRKATLEEMYAQVRAEVYAQAFEEAYAKAFEERQEDGNQ